MSINNNRVKVEYNRFVIQEDPELGVYSVKYLGDYEALVESNLVDAIASETHKKKELVAMILGTTKIVRNLTPESPDKVDDANIIASICELLDARISPIEITLQFLINMPWCRIEKVLRAKEKAVSVFKKYRKPL